MTTIKLLWEKVHRRWVRMRFQPIRVFCFHQVSDEFEPDMMWECDWTNTDVFKRNINAIKQKYAFISLTEAKEHLKNDLFRVKRYAVLTADDGWESLQNILPWLAEQSIPVTLFLNPYYMDGIHYQLRPTERFLTFDELFAIEEKYYPMVTCASHGWNHGDCLEMGWEEFINGVRKSEKALQGALGKIPFFAFTFGHFNDEQMRFLKEELLTPVLMDGEKNYTGVSCIHRELLDGKETWDE